MLGAWCLLLAPPSSFPRLAQHASFLSPCLIAVLVLFPHLRLSSAYANHWVWRLLVLQRRGLELVHIKESPAVGRGRRPFIARNRSVGFDFDTPLVMHS